MSTIADLWDRFVQFEKKEWHMISDIVNGIRAALGRASDNKAADAKTIADLRAQAAADAATIRDLKAQAATDAATIADLQTQLGDATDQLTQLLDEVNQLAPAADPAA